METYSVIKKVNGLEINQVNAKPYATKEDAINAGNSWLRDCTVHAEIRKERGFEVVENTENSLKFTGIEISN
jgi:hypothetical protein